MNVTEFRRELENIINKDIENSFDEHIKPIENLKKIYPHTVKLYSRHELSGDCFLYVFRDKIPSKLMSIFQKVTNDDRYREVCKDLISQGFLSLHNEQQENDKIIVYFKDGMAVHFGKIQNRRFISKWGKSFVWEHGFFEVPLCYGNVARFSDGVINNDVFENVVETYARRYSISVN